MIYTVYVYIQFARNVPCILIIFKIKLKLFLKVPIRRYKLNKENKMQKVLKTLQEEKFNKDILLIWSYPQKGLICIRHRRTGQVKVIKL